MKKIKAFLSGLYKKVVRNKKYLTPTLITIGLIVGIMIAEPYIVKYRDGVRLSDVEEVTYKNFMCSLEDELIDTVYMSDATGKKILYFTDLDGIYHKTMDPEYEGFKKEVLESGVMVKPISDIDSAEVHETSRRSMIMMVIFTLFCFLAYFMYKLAKLPEETNKPIVIGKRKATDGISDGDVSQAKTEVKKQDPNVKLFSDVIGLDEVKDDLKVIVDFINNRDKYEKAGAKLPRGVLLYGPPGTGKTLLAKAVAGEAGVPFLYKSGSEFIEMYVGVGPKRIRELFNTAKRQAPCIVFIDEIDAIGGKRTSNDNGEDRKTIDALLTEMNGFKDSDNIIVIGATNKLEELDPALVRSGRFDDKFCVPLPASTNERCAILEFYSKNKILDETVNLTDIAEQTKGFSPADLEFLLNQAAIIMVQKKKNAISRDILDMAMTKTLLQGHIKENQSNRDKEELELVAYHEAGHALIGHYFGKEITKVTILSSTSGAGGYTASIPKKEALHSVKDLKEDVMELYGGRGAELILYDDPEKITTGASNDIDRATDIIKGIVTRYAMTEEYGMLNVERLGVKQDIIIDKEVQMSKELYAQTVKILNENKDKLRQIAELLLKKQTIYKNELKELLD